MADLSGTLTTLLPVYGPWLLFALAVLETCFVTGLVVPSGLATSVATALALDGELDLAPILLAAGAGGWVGDSLGFWVGRASGDHFLHGTSRYTRLYARRQPELRRFFGRHPFFSVTLARLVSFVRTLMPMAAGMSGLTYRRFLPYQAFGLVGWVALYAAIGAAGEEGWDAATREWGVAGGFAFLLGGGALWFLLRKGLRRRARRKALAHEPRGSE